MSSSYSSTRDNAGAGLSLQDTILRLRLDANNVVTRSHTRIIYVAQITKGSSPESVRLK
jgi:hypothetical protein